MSVGAQLAQVLSGSLNPATIRASEEQLRQMQGQEGFALQLLVISDDQNYSQAIRQSAVVYLKNLVQSHCEGTLTLAEGDLNSLRGSLLQALIRNVARKEVAPSLREVIYQLAERYYPREWPQLVEDAVARIDSSGDLFELLGSVEALRAVYSVFGGSVMKEIELSNLCNKTLRPLLGLISKLFQHFSPDTSAILVSCFKIIGAALKLYLPEMVVVNKHNIMILLKKVLDLQVPEHNYQHLVALKKISLRILFRIYQRHANPKTTTNLQFAKEFHEKYTQSFIESLVLTVVAGGNDPKRVKGHQLTLSRLALSCLAYLNRYNPHAANLLIAHRQYMLQVCLSRSLLHFNRSYQNFEDFKVYIHHKRLHLKEFLFSLMHCEAIPEEQNNAVACVLGLLFECLEKGNEQFKELALYLFSEISNEAEYFRESLDQKMTALIDQWVIPMLGSNHSPLVRARACELIQSYKDLELPQNLHIQLAKRIWECLSPAARSDKEAFLRIYACHAFNSLMQYPAVRENSKDNLPNILRVYTELLEADTSIIDNFKDLVELFEDEIAPMASHLATLLIELFGKQVSASNNGERAGRGGYGKGASSGEDIESESEDEEDEVNNESIAKACVASLRQLLQGQRSVLSEEVRGKLLDMVIYIFSDPLQMYVEEGYNILNLLLYKHAGQPDPKYYIFFQMIAFAIQGLPHQYLQGLRQQNDPFSTHLAQVLGNMCEEPDLNTIENSIGCLRNFIAKSSKDTLHFQKDQFGKAIIDYVMEIVKTVHQNSNEKRPRTQTERMVILTLYVTLVEYGAAGEGQLAEMVGNLQSWMAMEEEVYKQGYEQYEKGGQRGVPPKLSYSPIYSQILLLTIHLCPDAAKIIDVNNLIGKVYLMRAHYKCDYQLERVIFGLSTVLDRQLLGDQAVAGSLMGELPELVRRLCSLRVEGEKSADDRDMDEEAEVDFFGMDENTHMAGWQQGPSQKDMLLGGGNEEEEESDNDWEEEFNKFYDSPLDSQDPLKCLVEALQKGGQAYGALLEVSKQEELSRYLSNAPPKNRHE